jgi:hypothetical protein
MYREAIRRHLGAHLTPQQCGQIATLLGHAAAGATAEAPQKSGR